MLKLLLNGLSSVITAEDVAGVNDPDTTLVTNKDSPPFWK